MSNPTAAIEKYSRFTTPIFVIVVLGILVLSVYWQVGNYSFIGFDDPMYIYENLHVQKGLTKEGVSWAITTFDASNWHPLTWLSHMIDVQLFGLSAGWHHRMNVLYHLINTELLFLLLWRMTGGLLQSAFVAALFGVHPLHVESVAWVAERKDVLSTLFWILTMGAYFRYTKRPGVGRYLCVAGVFSLGLMCKPMLVTLPFVLLLLDWWPLGRASTKNSRNVRLWWFYRTPLSQLVWEKIPLLGLSTISCGITYLSQAKGESVRSFEYIPFGMRIGNAVVSYMVYLGKTVWPSSLAVFYPHPSDIHGGVPAWEITSAILVIGGLSFMVTWLRYSRPYLAVGWFWYLGALVPVIGLVQVGGQAMADRYTYIPLIGLFIAMAWEISDVLSKWRLRWIGVGLLGGVVIALSILARCQANYWRNNFTLFSHAIRVTDKNWMMINNLGLTYGKLGQHQQAISYYREVLRIKPGYHKAWNNLGMSHHELGHPQQAIIYYQEALKIKPDYAEAWNNLGAAYDEIGHPQNAISYYWEALKIKPDFPGAWYNLGATYDKLGHPQQAIIYYQEALRYQTNNADTWNYLGLAYAKLGKFQLAVACFQKVLQIRPDYPGIRTNLDAALNKLGTTH